MFFHFFRNISIGKIRSSMNFLRLQFDGNNLRILFKIDDDKGMEEIILSEYIPLYNGNKMLQNNPVKYFFFFKF